MTRPSRFALPPFAAVVAFALLLVTVAAGLRVGGFRAFDPFGRGRSLDYSTRPFSAVAPLRERFVAGVLGPAPVPAEPPPSGTILEPDRGFLSNPRIVDAHTFTNDEYEDAKPVSGLPYTARTTAPHSGRQSGEPTDCESTGGTAWYRYTPSSNVALVADTFGSDFTSMLGVFKGRSIAGLTLEACGATAPAGSQVAFPAKRGVSYYFQVSGMTGRSELVFSVTEQKTTRVSISSAGEQADQGSFDTAISGDGRFVAFSSAAGNLAPNAENPKCKASVVTGGPKKVARPANVFLRDRVAHQTTLVSRTVDGKLAECGSFDPALSADGRFVAFFSCASGLVEGDVNTSLERQIYVYDRSTGWMTKESVTPSGESGDGESSHVVLSGDGRFVAFVSDATDLVPGDSNGAPDVFVKDRKTGVTKRVSVSSSGEQANDAASAATGETGSDVLSLSKNGLFVTFISSATNLVPGDTNDRTDVFIRDLTAGKTERVSVSSAKAQADGDSLMHFRGADRTVTDDGRYVAFGSNATNLVPGDTNGFDDIFVRDRMSGTTTRVSVSSSGAQMNKGSTNDSTPGSQPYIFGGYSMSGDARYIAFDSFANNLSPDDTNPCPDVFVHDRLTGATIMVSIADTGELVGGDIGSRAPSISADGTFVAFEGYASNLVVGDTNGVADIFVHELPHRGPAHSGWH